MSDTGAYPVAVRICADDYVGIVFKRDSLCDRKCRRVFWIRLSYSREVSVVIRLLVHQYHIAEAFTLKRLRHIIPAGAVKRRIYHLQARGCLTVYIGAAFLHGIHESVHDLLTDVCDPVIIRWGDSYRQRILKLVHIAGYDRCRLIAELAARIVIHLESVVLAGVVACRYHYAAVACEVSDSKRKQRHR